MSNIYVIRMSLHMDNVVTFIHHLSCLKFITDTLYTISAEEMSINNKNKSYSGLFIASKNS